MASTSASSVQKCFKYDVFLSFRGEDARKNFVDHLYHALNQKGIYTYKDDQEIKKGERISDELITSIKDSKIFIIVFSKNYASSSWCLEELVKIMECQKTNEQTAYPVFYDVEPTEIRNLSGAVGEAFANHHVNAEVAGRWRDALKEAASLAGLELKNTFDGYEAKFIQKVVEDISLELRFINSSVDEKLVGMEERVGYVVSSLEIDIDDVRFIGIKGMGGAGKTTLARAVYDKISYMFEGSSFVENVRECSKDTLGGLKSLQKQILSDVLEKQDITTINGVYDGIRMMKRRMCGIKVLVVLDDVDHIDQLEALAGKLNWFKPGSRVIITTREEQVLVAHRVPNKLILNVNLLFHSEAICLFSRYAFGTEMPIKGYEELSEQVVRYADGLPLTIRVLGSDLCGKDKLDWIDRLERLRTIPLNETLQKLELSYNSLEEDHKEIFLDVACMLKGWEKEKAIRALESCGFNARSGLRVLEQKSLIIVSYFGHLSMHDHIEEMGKNIVSRVHPDEPYKHTRLSIKIEDLPVEDKGIEAVTRCLKVELDPTDLHKMKKCLRNMNRLRFLDVKFVSKKTSNMYPDRNYYPNYGNRLSKYLRKYFQANNLVCDYLPDSLKYLSWDGYPYKCLPKYFEAKNLVGIEIFSCKIEHLSKRGERKVLNKLKFLNMCSCDLKTLDIGLLVNLERLDIQRCGSLVELHMPAENFQLKHLILYQTKLRTLNLLRARNLETLNLSKCVDLVELHMPIKLKHLSFQGSNWKTLNLSQTPNLETLHLTTLPLLCKDSVELHVPFRDNNDLLELHLPFEKLKLLVLRCSKMKTLNLARARNLELLDLDKCEDLLELHMPVKCLELKTIHVPCSKLTTLDLRGTRNLEMLDLKKCVDLVEFHVSTENLKLKTINIPCSKFRTLNLIGTRHLDRLNIEQCEDLVDHNTIESHELETVTIRCSKLRNLNLTQTQNIRRLNLAHSGDLVELHMPIECPELKTIDIRCSKLTTLDLTGTKNLERLDLEQCEDLVELRMPIDCPELKTINIRCSKLTTLDLTGTGNLERLNLEQCKDLVELRMPIESPKLKSINIPCSKLAIFNLGRSPYLECLDLNDCFTLEEISALVGCLGGFVKFKPFWINPGFPMVGCFSELNLKARSIGKCTLHPDNSLPMFHFECVYRELLPLSTQNLEKLITFSICPCTNLVSLSERICGLQRLRKLTLANDILEVPNEIERLECLEELTLKSTKIEYLPDNICALEHLKLLQLESCWFLKQLPDDIGRLQCLEELLLTDCTSLRDIPNNICEMKRLKCFHLTNCKLVKKLPKEMGRLTCLKELNIEGADIIHLPESIFQLEDLRFLL